MTTRAQANRQFGSYIRTRREELGLSLRQLEERTGISNSRLSRWERGLEHPSRPDRLVPLAKGLELDLTGLYASSLGSAVPTLPALPTYLQQRYGHLSEAAQAEICQAADDIASRDRTHLHLECGSAATA